MTLKGGCSCQAVQYEITSPEPVVALCHCVQCQAMSGTVFGTNLMVPASELHLSPSSTSAIKKWQRPGSSGATCTNSFCSNCGTTVFSQTEAENMKAMRFIKAGTLEDKKWLREHRPVMEINRPEGVGWVGDLVRQI
ncbi:hypothetical protein NA57DRAFT_75886 [Rhizodiscina lignyota]|uniref:CENP-V/GFA domain-containing protein n=1 Tax=Rhizodiscina lignyota TaxID=1504668 RepID=A0A9P4MAD1_9PEZI|nr:hypothetical protein NA57DRAFT_75886 [Rhizodiscina lignyota]